MILQLCVQSLDTPVRKLKLLWPKVKQEMEKMSNGVPGSFPRLEKVANTLKQGSVYHGVTLLPGWLITESQTKGLKNKLYTWSLRDEEEIEQDHINFARELMVTVSERIEAVISNDLFAILEVFDASYLVTLHCAKKGLEGIRLDISDGDYDSYRIENCMKIMSMVSKMKHIKKSGIDFYHRLAHRYMRALKQAVSDGIWKQLCPEWFLNDKNLPLRQRDATLVQFISTESKAATLFDSAFEKIFSNGTVEVVYVHEKRFYSSFYNNKEIYAF